MFSIVDVNLGQVIPEEGRTGLIRNNLDGRVRFPNGATVDNPPVGYENPPQYAVHGEPDAPVQFRIYEVRVIDNETGPRITKPDPVYDAGADEVTQTWTRATPPKPTIISSVDFQARFTATELDASTEFVDSIDMTTGKPSRPRMKQAMQRAVSRNSVDLLSANTGAFLDALVSGTVITAQRKTEILTP